MKKASLLLIFFLGTTIAFAQRHDPVSPQKDHMNFRGYTIRLLPALAGTFGYDIVKENHVVLHQIRNPFSGTPMGLRSKEDVYKVARWQIENLKKPPAAPALQQRFKPKAQVQQVIVPRPTAKVAEQLHINMGKH